MGQHLHYELAVAKNMKREKTSHDALPQLRRTLTKAQYQLSLAQKKLRHEQLEVGGLLAPEKLHAPSPKGGAIETSLSQDSSSNSNHVDLLGSAHPRKQRRKGIERFSPAMRKAVAMARQAEAERFKPEVESEQKRRRVFRAAKSQLAQTEEYMRKSKKNSVRDSQMLRKVTHRIKQWHKAATESLQQAKTSFQQADKLVRKAQNAEAFKVGAKLLKGSKKVPTSKDIMSDLMK